MRGLPDFPETAWRGPFKEYRRIIEDVSVCPLPYHYGNLLSVLSAQMGDFAILDEGVRTFLNYFVFIYGRTGTKKSTAMDLVNEHVVENLTTPHARELSAVSSAEGLIRTLSQTQNVRLCYDEVKHLFAVASRSGNAIEPVLNKAFGLGKLETVVRDEGQSIAAQNYFFNLDVNGTPVHISLDVGEALFHGGLLNRFLVFAALPSDRDLDELGIPNAPMVRAFVDKLSATVERWRAFAPNRASVRVRMSPAAKALYTPWYKSIEAQIRTANELIADPIQRVSLYAKKLAATYCLYEADVPTASPEATVDQMRAAIDVASYCQASIIFMSSAWTGAKSLHTRAEALAEQRMEVYFSDYGCVTEREIIRDLHMGINETKRALTALASVGAVFIGVETSPKIHYKEKCECFEHVDG